MSPLNMAYALLNSIAILFLVSYTYVIRLTSRDRVPLFHGVGYMICSLTTLIRSIDRDSPSLSLILYFYSVGSYIQVSMVNLTAIRSLISRGYSRILWHPYTPYGLVVASSLIPAIGAKSDISSYGDLAHYSASSLSAILFSVVTVISMMVVILSYLLVHRSVMRSIRRTGRVRENDYSRMVTYRIVSRVALFIMTWTTTVIVCILGIIGESIPYTLGVGVDVSVSLASLLYPILDTVSRRRAWIYPGTETR